MEATPKDKARARRQAPLGKGSWSLYREPEHVPACEPVLSRRQAIKKAKGKLSKTARLPREGQTKPIQDALIRREASYLAGKKTLSNIGAPVRAIEGGLTQVDPTSFGKDKAIRSTIYRQGEQQVKRHGRWERKRYAARSPAEGARLKLERRAALVAASIARKADIVEPHTKRVLISYADALLEVIRMREAEKPLVTFNALTCKLP